MTYEVEGSVLLEYKRLFEKYSTHKDGCSFYILDVCDCGYRSDLENFKTMFKFLIKEKENYG